MAGLLSCEVGADVKALLFSGVTRVDERSVTGRCVSFLLNGVNAFLLVTIMLLVSACGGGGARSPDPQQPTTTTGNPPGQAAHLVENLSVDSVGADYATISWTTTRDATVQIAYGPTASFGSETVQTTSLAKTHTVTINGLTVNSEYHFKVRAFDAASEMVESTTNTFDTADYILANPSNYLSLLRALQPGDTLYLQAGNYDDLSDAPGLPFFSMHGTASSPITITGPSSGARAVLLGRSYANTVRFDDASYIVVKNLEIDGRNLGGDGVKGQGTSHHITLENLYIHGVGSNQAIVGISTKAPAWDWVVRNNTIVGAGTGIYFGNSDGNQPFIRGLVEGNLIVDTIGYNMEIKHQNPRPSIAGIPTGDNTTTIRYNVFSKANNFSVGGFARPNLLVGHWPINGVGSNDTYNIYGNFFYQNGSGEPLFQGEGNVMLHNNVFVNSTANAINIQAHNHLPRRIRIFSNTVLAANTGIRVTGVDSNYQQKVIGNAVFAATPIFAADQADNVTDILGNAANYLKNPTGTVGVDLDLYPLSNVLRGPAIDSSSYNTYNNWDKGYNQEQRNGTWRGAYSAENAANNTGPQLALEKRSYNSLAP